MSRERKFRIWDDEKQEYANFIEHPLRFIPDKNRPDELRLGFKNPYIVEQYTGLKDKNGKEIYEGDIVRYADDYEENAEVVFDDGGFQVEWPINIERLEGDITCMMEVIGNIHEDKELLGGEE